MKLYITGESRRKILSWDSLSKRDKNIMWKDPFRESQQYVRYGREIYNIKSFSIPPNRFNLNEEFDLIRYTSYTSGLGVVKYTNYWKVYQFNLEVE